MKISLLNTYICELTVSIFICFSQYCVLVSCILYCLCNGRSITMPMYLCLKKKNFEVKTCSDINLNSCYCCINNFVVKMQQHNEILRVWLRVVCRILDFFKVFNIFFLARKYKIFFYKLLQSNKIDNLKYICYNKYLKILTMKAKTSSVLSRTEAAHQHVSDTININAQTKTLYIFLFRSRL